MISSADHSQLARNNSNSQVYHNQTIIQIQAEIPGVLNGGVITLQTADNDVDNSRAFEIINNALGQLQDAVEVRGRFRVQEKQLNGMLLNGAHEEIQSQIFMNNYASNDNKTINSQDKLESVKPLKKLDQSPLLRIEQQDQSANNQMISQFNQNKQSSNLSMNHNIESSNRFGGLITTLNLNSIHKKQVHIDDATKNNSKRSQQVPDSPYVKNSDLVKQLINETPSSKKINQRDLFLLNSKSKSQTGYVPTGPKNNLNDSSEENFNIENENYQSNDSKVHKFDKSAYRTNRLNSDASLADREDNYPNIGKKSKQNNKTSGSHKSHDTSNKDDDNDRASEEDRSHDNDDDEENKHNEEDMDQMDSNNHSQNKKQHILQETELNKSNKSNDPGNEADAQSEANDIENGDEKDQTLDNEKIQKQLQQDKEQQQLMRDKYGGGANQPTTHYSGKLDEKHLDGYKYSSEMRSDKSQQDIESPNDDYSQSINNFKMNFIGGDEKKRDKSIRTRKDRGETVYQKQIITSNEQLDNDLGYRNDHNHNHFGGQLNNSQHHSTKRFDWNHIQNEDSFQNVKISSPMKQSIKMNSIHESMDFQSKVQQNRGGGGNGNIFDGSSNSQNKVAPYQQNSMYGGNLDNTNANIMNNTSNNSNTFQRELFQNFNRYNGQGMKSRLDSENIIETNQINATLGQSSSNINDQEELSSSILNTQQYTIKRGGTQIIESNHLKEAEKKKILEEDDEEEKIEIKKNKKKTLKYEKKHLDRDDEEDIDLDNEAEIEQLFQKFKKIIKNNKGSKNNNKKRQQHRKSNVDQQRGESQTSLKKLIKSSKQDIDDCEQKGRFTIKNSTEDKNNESKNKKSKGRILFNGGNANDSQKLKINSQAFQDQLSPNPQMQYLQQMQLIRDQSNFRNSNISLGFNQNQLIDQSLMMQQPFLSQSNQHLMMMSSFNPHHQSMLSYNPIFQQQNQSPNQTSTQKASMFDLQQTNLNNQFFKQQKVQVVPTYEQNTESESKSNIISEGQSYNTKARLSNINKQQSKDSVIEGGEIKKQEEIKKQSTSKQDKIRSKMNTPELDNQESKSNKERGHKQSKNKKQSKSTRNNSNVPPLSQIPILTPQQSTNLAQGGGYMQQNPYIQNQTAFHNHLPNQYQGIQPVIYDHQQICPSYQMQTQYHPNQTGAYLNSHQLCQSQYQSQVVQSQIFDQMLRHQQVMFNQMLNCHSSIISQVLNQQQVLTLQQQQQQHQNQQNMMDQQNTQLDSNNNHKSGEQQQDYDQNESADEEYENEDQVSEDEMGSIKEDEGSSEESSVDSREQNQGNSFAVHQHRRLNQQQRKNDQNEREQRLMAKLYNMISGTSQTSSHYDKQIKGKKGLKKNKANKK